jgi:hypothetical protein
MARVRGYNRRPELNLRRALAGESDGRHRVIAEDLAEPSSLEAILLFVDQLLDLLFEGLAAIIAMHHAYSH